MMMIVNSAHEPTILQSLFLLHTFLHKETRGAFWVTTYPLFGNIIHRIGRPLPQNLNKYR